MALTVTSGDLDTFLGLSGTIDTSRATLLLDLATSLCETIVATLPDAAKAVVLTAAARAYVNPAGKTAETLGPATIGFGGNGSAGVYLTRADVVTLRRAAGGGGAFTIDPTPTDAMSEIWPWEINVTNVTEDGDLFAINEDDPEGGWY